MKKIIAFIAIFLAYSHTAYAALGRTIQQNPGSGTAIRETQSESSGGFLSSL